MRRARGERGVASVEFAIVSLLFISLLYGIITFGFVFALDHNMSHAAAEGARSAILKSNTSATTTQIQDSAKATARDRLSFEKAQSVADVDATVASCVSDPAVDCITVTIEYDYATNPLVPALFNVSGLFGTLTAESTVQLD